MSSTDERASNLRDRLGVPVEWHASLASTNQRARELGRTAAPDGTVVVSDEQTAGRGRRGRVWHSPPGAGLYASVLIRDGAWIRRPELAQLAAGVAVAEAVQAAGAAGAELVWPNDCHVAGRKLAGVLVEAEAMEGRLQFLVCGIGVNVRFGEATLPEGLWDTAVDLAAVARVPVDRATLTGDVLGRLQQLRRQSEDDGGTTVLQRWRQLGPMASGAEVEVETPAGRLHGTTAGLADNGALRLKVQGQEMQLLVGEVVRVRRRP